MHVWSQYNIFVEKKTDEARILTGHFVLNDGIRNRRPGQASASIVNQKFRPRNSPWIWLPRSIGLTTPKDRIDTQSAPHRKRLSYIWSCWWCIQVTWPDLSSQGHVRTLPRKPEAQYNLKFAACGARAGLFYLVAEVMASQSLRARLERDRQNTLPWAARATGPQFQISVAGRAAIQRLQDSLQRDRQRMLLQDLSTLSGLVCALCKLGDTEVCSCLASFRMHCSLIEALCNALVWLQREKDIAWCDFLDAWASCTRPTCDSCKEHIHSIPVVAGKCSAGLVLRRVPHKSEWSQPQLSHHLHWSVINIASHIVQMSYVWCT